MCVNLQFQNKPAWTTVPYTTASGTICWDFSSFLPSLALSQFLCPAWQWVTPYVKTDLTPDAGALEVSVFADSKQYTLVMWAVANNVPLTGASYSENPDDIKHKHQEAEEFKCKQKPASLWVLSWVQIFILAFLQKSLNAGLTIGISHAACKVLRLELTGVTGKGDKEKRFWCFVYFSKALESFLVFETEICPLLETRRLELPGKFMCV